MPLKKLALLFSLFTFVACSSEDPQSNSSEHLSRAQIYQDQGQYKAAIIEFRNAVKTSDGGTESVVLYAGLLNDLGRFRNAAEMLENIQGEKGDDYYLALVDAYVGLKKYQSAERSLAFIKGDIAGKVFYQAKIALGRGALDQAKGLYQTLLTHTKGSDEDKAAAKLGLAMLAARENNMTGANELLAQIGEGQEVYAEAQVVKAGIQIVGDDLVGAETTLSYLLSRLANTDIMKPVRAVVLERLAYVLTRLGRSNEAYIYQKLLAEAFPGANEVSEKFNSALTSFQDKDFVQAKASLQSILAEYPTHDRAKQLLGVISYLQGETLAASEYLDDSVDAETADPLTRHIYAATNLKLNDPKKVLEILGADIEQSNSSSTLALYGLAAISDGQSAKGEAALLKAAKLSPDDVRIRLALASHYRTSKPSQISKELTQLEAAYASAPTDRQVLTDLVAHYLRNDGQQAAGKFISSALKASPKAFSTNLVAGFYQVSAGELDKALMHFSAALDAKSTVDDYSEALYAKGRSELGLNKTEAAEKTFTEMVRVYPKSEDAYTALFALYEVRDGRESAADKLVDMANRMASIEPLVVLIKTYLASGEPSVASRYYQEAKAVAKDSPQLIALDQAIRYSRAVSAHAQQDFKSARNLISALLGERPDSARLISTLVDIEISDGQFTEAKKVLAQLEAMDARHPVLPVLQGDLALAQQDFATAQSSYEESWRANPTNVVGDKLLAVLSLRNDEKGRQAHVARWLDSIPNAPKPMLLTAIKFQERGQTIKASEMYQKVLSVQPNNIAALNNLGWLYFESNDPGSEDLLRRAQKLAPNNPAVLDSLGWVLYKRGNAEEGIRYLEKANQLAPDNEEISKHLAEAKRGV